MEHLLGGIIKDSFIKLFKALSEKKFSQDPPRIQNNLSQTPCYAQICQQEGNKAFGKQNKSSHTNKYAAFSSNIKIYLFRKPQLRLIVTLTKMTKCKCYYDYYYFFVTDEPKSQVFSNITVKNNSNHENRSTEFVSAL